MKEKMSSREATLLFAELQKRGQQIADVEQRKFVILRDGETVYKLSALEELSYEERSKIVKRIKPRTQSGEQNATHQVRGLGSSD